MNGKTDDLPVPWFEKLEGGKHNGWGWVDYPARRAAEDTAALAWSRLTDKEREACRREMTGD